jgi:hypothetical protein
MDISKELKDHKLLARSTVPAEIRGRLGFIHRVPEHGSAVAAVAKSSASSLSQYCIRLPHFAMLAAMVAYCHQKWPLMAARKLTSFLFSLLYAVGPG